jgi:hypothetical protein
MLRNGETHADIARTYGVDATTIGRLDCLPAKQPVLAALMSRRLLAPFLGPFLHGKRFVADVINYVAGFIFSTIKPMTR